MSAPSGSTERGGAHIQVAQEGTSIRISGVLRDADAESWIWPIFESVHRAACSNRVTEVVLDLRHLEYANAAAWRCIVLWLRRLHVDESALYSLCIKSQPAFQWQRVAIPSLLIFGKDRLLVQPAGG